MHYFSNEFYLTVTCRTAVNLPSDYHFTDTTPREVSAVGIKKTLPESKVCSFNLPSAVALSVGSFRFGRFGQKLPMCYISVTEMCQNCFAVNCALLVEMCRVRSSAFPNNEICAIFFGQPLAGLNPFCHFPHRLSHKSAKSSTRQSNHLDDRTAFLPLGISRNNRCQFP